MTDTKLFKGSSLFIKISTSGTGNLKSDEPLKSLVSVIRINKNKWIKSLARDFNKMCIRDRFCFSVIIIAHNEQNFNRKFIVFQKNLQNELF